MTASSVRDPFGLVGVVLQNEYRIDAVVGEGGYGVVYRGVHLGLEQPIAIKVLKGLELEDRRMQDALFAKFKDEAKLLYTLSQESLTIVRSMDFGAVTTPSGAWAPFMVLEWLEGRSLAEDLAHRRAQGLRGRSVEEALALLEPAAQGLTVAHHRRVAHRDIKPGNFFLVAGSHGPRTKVLDFGIAKMMKDGEEAGTKATFASFTWLYGAPEQLDPRYGTTGLATDVYAFALVVTELLTDRPPVEGRDVVSILKTATDPTVRPTPRARGAANVSDAVEVVCRRALAVDPGGRYANIGELWHALAEAAKQRPVTMAVPSMRETPPPGRLPVPTHPVATHQPTPPPVAPFPGGPMMVRGPHPSWTGPQVSPPPGTAPPGTHVPTGTHRRPLPPRPAETSSIVPVAVVLFVLAILFAGSCALLHQAC